MSAYQMAVRTVYRGVDLGALKAKFWKFWIGLYAEPKSRRFVPYY